MSLRAPFLLSLMIATTLPATGAQVAGVALPDEVRLEGLEAPLVLNGAGIREKFFVDIYVGALYLAQRQVGVGSLLTQPPANRVAMVFVYSEVEKRKLDAAWRGGFRRNLPAQRFAALEKRLEHFVGFFRDMRAGDRVWLDYVPGQATRISINGTRVGAIEGADFNSALLAVWLGKEPVTQALKKAMVGVDKQ